MLWKTIKDRIYAFKEVWIQQPIIRWLLAAFILNALIGGWIFGSLVLRFDGAVILLTFKDLGIFSGFCILLFLQRFLKKRERKLNRYAILIYGTIGRSILIPLYAYPSKPVFALICLLDGILSVSVMLTTNTLFKGSLPKKQEEHLGPAWVHATLWTMCWAFIQPFGFLFLSIGGNLWLWGGLGSILALVSLIPLRFGKSYIQAARIEEEERNEKVDNSKPADHVTMSPVKMLLILFLMSGGIYIVVSSLVVLPLYIGNPTLGGTILSVGSIAIILGGLISVLLSERWAKPTIRTLFVLIFACALIFAITNHWVVILIGVIIIQASAGLFQQLFSHRMVVNQKNKMLGVALPSMLLNTCSAVAHLSLGTIPTEIVFLALAMVMLFPIMLFKLFDPYLTVPKQES